ncbi:hypothetical protein AAC387_Pa11g1988 [Persea americana]
MLMDSNVKQSLMDPNAEQKKVSNPNSPIKYSSKYELMSLSFLCFTNIITIIRSHDQPWEIPYAVNVCFLAVLLFLCIDVFSRLPGIADKQEKLKAPIFILINIINFSYVYAISDCLTPTTRRLMWFLIWSTLIFGTLFTFVCPIKTNHKDKDRADANGCSLPVEGLE